MGGRYKYREELQRAKLVIAPDGNYAETWLHRNDYADNWVRPNMNSTFRDIDGKDISKKVNGRHQNH